MTKVVHVIGSLDTGGAEMMLCKLLTSSPAHTGCIISLMPQDNTQIARRLASHGVKVYYLHFGKTGNNIDGLVKLRNILRNESPDIIQGWMYHGNLVSLLVSLLFHKVPVIWNIRHSLVDVNHEKPFTRMVIRLCAAFSRLPHAIVNNSQTSIQQHDRFGFNAAKWHFIGNGFDTTRFIRNPEAHREIRVQYGIAEHDVVIGLIARFHPMKGFDIFLEAARILTTKHSAIKFMLAGRDVDHNNAALRRQIEASGLASNVLLIGETDQPERVIAGLDIATSASTWGEGFSNAIGEAMACEVPCVVTNVGDSKYLVSDTGISVEPNNPVAIAEAWERLILLRPSARAELGLRARQRITSNYSIPAIVKQYDDLYERISAITPYLH